VRLLFLDAILTSSCTSIQKDAEEGIQAARGASVSSFARAFLSQDPIDDGRDRGALEDITTENMQISEPGKKRKRTRLVLDARTELTDEELKVNGDCMDLIDWPMSCSRFLELNT
jgi:hypothetical protein